MRRPYQHWLKSREIATRLVIEGDLELLTPAHFGAGDADSPADMALLLDAAEGLALLPGASIGGAIRSYWRERALGNEPEAGRSLLFGARRAETDEKQAYQSALIIDDAFGDRPPIEVREGVAIDAATRTAEDKKLFDMETLPVGARFHLRFELLLPKDTGTAAELCRDLAIALEGLERGEIGLGARKRRGLGQCQVREWRVRRYDLTTNDGLLAWLAEEREWADRVVATEQVDRSIWPALSLSLKEPRLKDRVEADRRERFEIAATLALTSSLLIRSGTSEADLGPDMIHLHGATLRDGQLIKDAPLIAGTSLAGVLRARARRIARTLTTDDRRADELVSAMFGVGPETDREIEPQASRVIVKETSIAGARKLVQNRIRVDRFTGGALDSYLFNEAPVFGGEDSRVVIELSLRQPKPHEIGLLLLLLKDLWTGDLPIGGESGVGRGRLAGLRAEVRHSKPIEVGKKPAATYWLIEQQEDGLSILDPEGTNSTAQDLENFVDELHVYLTGGRS